MDGISFPKPAFGDEEDAAPVSQGARGGDGGGREVLSST